MIFVDTSAWLMAALRKSPAAAAAASALAEHRSALVTTDSVLTETWNGLQRRRGPSIATRTCLDILAGTRLLDTRAEDRSSATDILGTWRDQPFSYGDALSFTVMEANGIHTVLTFDRHFTVYRYGPRRDRSFTVLP